ncbi:MAG: 4Fe-4S dicluster domain-containing protein [bacterium]|nr:4Fe-4S dicluster domain-containing protein [bacterium]
MGDLFRRTLDVATRAARSGVDRRFPPRRRPPGASPEPAFLTQCTRCGACAEACPHDAIHHFDEETGPLAGTPVLIPENRACHQCEDFPCAAACPEPALQMPSTTTWPLGRVRLVEEHCIAFMGPECGACINTCPADAPALRLEHWRPHLDAEFCVGCGLCIERCPTSPKALELEPLEGGVTGRQ